MKIDTSIKLLTTMHKNFSQWWNIYDSDYICPTLTAGMVEGVGQVPMIMEIYDGCKVSCDS